AEVESAYLESMVELPSLIAIRNQDDSYQSKWSPFEDQFADQMDNLDTMLTNQSIDDGDYHQEATNIQKNREKKQREKTIEWLKERLNTLGLHS
ncbi:MAG: hypothetical protein ACH350_03880, partial [Parachlamydiaceae bacterium]